MNAMTVAIAKAAKAENAKNAAVLEAQEAYNVNSVTTKTEKKAVVKTQQSEVKKPPQLYKVEEIANKAGCSLSYVYLMISKLKPAVMAKDGKTSLYGEDFLAELNNVPRRKFAHRVRVIPQKEAVTVMKAELTKDSSVANMQQKENNPISLLERIATLEKKVLELSQLLGI